MNIEFSMPEGMVKEWLVDYVRDKLIELHHENPELSRAHIIFRSHDNTLSEKICELEIPSYGLPIYIHRAASSFEEAVREVLVDLRDKLLDKVRLRNDPPDIITSTIDIQD